MDELQCITLWEPWATLVVTGQKQWETRSWAIRYRGPLLIHAAKVWPDEVKALCRQEPFASTLAPSLALSPDLSHTRGRILGMVEVVGCVSTEAIRRALSKRERAFGDYGVARFAWELSRPVAFREPVLSRGARGLYTVPASKVPEAVALLGGATHA